MKFRKEVQKQFEKAGWFEGRNVKEKFDNIPRFEEFPKIAKDFLYEYGDLEVEMLGKHVTGIFNTKAILLGFFKLGEYLDKKSIYGNIKTIPLADYHLDSAAIECGFDGSIYVTSDCPNYMSENFKEGIEKVIMEDYSDVFWWDFEKKMWSKEDMF